MQAFHGNAELKAQAVGFADAHYLADEIAQRMYVGEQDDGRPGYCNVGCVAHTNDNPHQVLEKRYGIPLSVSYLSDRIFEGLTDPDYKEFPRQFYRAIPVGADLSLVTAHFMVWLLADPVDGVIRFAREDGKAAIETVVALYQRRISGDEPTHEEWSAAAAAAYATAADAAAAAYAAYAADATAAAFAAADAAYAAYATDAATYRQMRDKLLSLLAEAPIMEAA